MLSQKAVAPSINSCGRKAFRWKWIYTGCSPTKWRHGSYLSHVRGFLQTFIWESFLGSYYWGGENRCYYMYMQHVYIDTHRHFDIGHRLNDFSFDTVDRIQGLSASSSCLPVPFTGHRISRQRVLPASHVSHMICKKNTIIRHQTLFHLLNLSGCLRDH